MRRVGPDLGGLPLGMTTGHEFRSCTVEMPAGAAFVLCTDGVTEAMDLAGRCYGLERLEAILAGSGKTASEIGRQILTDVERYAAGAGRSDDVCLVCVRRQADAEPA